MMQVFIDESGQLGLSEGYFIIALVVFENTSRIKNFAKRFCSEHSIDEIHASKLTFPQKQELMFNLNKLPDYSVSYIVVDKLLAPRELYRNTNLLFYHLFSLLVQSLISKNTDDMYFMVDKRDVPIKSVNSLWDIIQLRAYAEWQFSHQLFIEYRDSRDCKQLQIADVIANSISQNPSGIR